MPSVVTSPTCWQSYEKMREMQKENLLFFSFPSASNFGEGRVTKRAVTKDGFWKIKVCQGECAGGQSPDI